jgi:hypothetical protein
MLPYLPAKLLAHFLVRRKLDNVVELDFFMIGFPLQTVESSAFAGESIGHDCINY